MWKAFNLDKIEKWARKNPVTVSICLLLVVVSSFVTLVEGFAKLLEFYEKTIGDNHVEYRKIKSLAVDTKIEYFTDILGAPAFKNRTTNNFEYVFVRPKYYVQAVTDLENKVLLFAVTTRKSDFHPVLDLGAMEVDGNKFAITLGKTKFGEISSSPTYIFGDQGARRSWYWEKYYFGNPGFYQFYFFANADSGYPHNDTYVPYEDIEKLPRGAGDMQSIDISKIPNSVRNFRDHCVINTYGVSSLASELDESPFDIGADLDQVRVLK